MSADMYARAGYADLAAELTGELEARLRAAATAGISPDRVILDPGIGFGKRGAQNWQALRALDRVIALGPRVLVGTSRKRFLAEVLTDAEATATAAARVPGDAGSVDAAPVDAARLDAARLDLATAVTSVLAAQAGVWAVRVHDVAATRDALAVAHAWSAGVPAETTNARARTADARGGTR